MSGTEKRDREALAALRRARAEGRAEGEFIGLDRAIKCVLAYELVGVVRGEMMQKLKFMRASAIANAEKGKKP